MENSEKSVFTLSINNINAVENIIEGSALRGLEVCGIQIENYGRTNLTINGSVDTGLLRNSLAHAISGEVPSIGSSYASGSRNRGTLRKARSYKANKPDENGDIKKGTYTRAAPKKVKGDLRVYVGTNVYYAPYVEMGHRQNVGQFVAKLGKRLVAPFVKAKPFLRPAFTEHIQEYRDILGMYIAQGAEDFNNK